MVALRIDRTIHVSMAFTRVESADAAHCCKSTISPRTPARLLLPLHRRAARHLAVQRLQAGGTPSIEQEDWGEGEPDRKPKRMPARPGQVYPLWQPWTGSGTGVAQ